MLLELRSRHPHWSTESAVSTDEDVDDVEEDELDRRWTMVSRWGRDEDEVSVMRTGRMILTGFRGGEWCW